MTSRRNTLITSACAAGALTLAVLSPLTSGAAAAPGDGDPGCPAAFPVGELAQGLEARGLTTAGYYRGGPTPASTTTPEEFSGTYLGTVEDATGDLFLFELSGSRITDASGRVDAGIWSGISGSPLYAADGRLIGSVSYSFTETAASVIAGVTPAADLYALLEETGPTPAARIRLDKGEQQMLRKAGVPAKAAGAPLVRLTTPKVLAGMSRLPGNQAATTKMMRALAKKSGVTAPQAAGGTTTQDEEIAIVPGGNVAVANSYGSLALYSVGTAAAVCDGVVIGYGHSNDWSPFGATIHGAATTTIMADGAWSYKMANLGAPMGTLLHDRLNGITGRLGELPAGTTVQVTSAGPKGRTTESVVSEPDALSYVVGNQVYRDALLTLDEMASGTGTISWDITFTRENGTSATFTRSQTYASAFSIADEMPSDVAGDVDLILDNGFEDVTITDVSVRQELDRTYRAYEIGRVETKIGGAWSSPRNGSRIKVKPGKKLKVRVHLERAGRNAQVTPVSRTFTFKVPKNAVGNGSLSVSGNGWSFWDFDEFFYEDDANEGAGSNEQPKNLDALLEQIASTPLQDSLTAALVVTTKKGKTRSATKQWSPGAVTFGEFMTTVKMVKAKKGKKGKKK